MMTRRYTEETPMTDWADEKAREMFEKARIAYGPREVEIAAQALRDERESCAEIAEAIDSGRGNEKEIAVAIRART